MSECTHAQLHVSLFVPNVGTFGPTLDTKAPGKNKVDKITVNDGFLCIESNKKTFLTPLTNVIVLVPKL